MNVFETTVVVKSLLKLQNIKPLEYIVVLLLVACHEGELKATGVNKITARMWNISTRLENKRNRPGMQWNAPSKDVDGWTHAIIEA